MDRRLSMKTTSLIRLCAWCLVLSFANLFPHEVSAQNLTNVTLANVAGFENNSVYPLGNLQNVSDGSAIWFPAGNPAQIVSIGSTNGKVLRRIQTGMDNTDFISFPAVSNGVLTIQFDARASTAA